MPSPAPAQDFIVTNGIGAKYIPASNVLLISMLGEGPLPLLLVKAPGGVGELLVDESVIQRLGDRLGGKTRTQMEEAFSVAARGFYTKVVFSTD